MILKDISHKPIRELIDELIDLEAQGFSVLTLDTEQEECTDFSTDEIYYESVPVIRVDYQTMSISVNKQHGHSSLKIE